MNQLIPNSDAGDWNQYSKLIETGYTTPFNYTIHSPLDSAKLKSVVQKCRKLFHHENVLLKRIKLGYCEPALSVDRFQLQCIGLESRIECMGFTRPQALQLQWLGFIV